MSSYNSIPPPPPFSETAGLLGGGREGAVDPGTNRKRRLAQVILFGVVFLVLALITSMALRPNRDGAMRAAGKVKNHHHHHHNNKPRTKFHRTRYNDIKHYLGGGHGDEEDVADTVIEAESYYDDDEEESLFLASQQEVELDATMIDEPLMMGKSRRRRSYCEDGGYSKRTLMRAYEMPFAALFLDTKGQTKFEASDVIVVNHTHVYAVCDSSWSISALHRALTPFANHQIGDPEREKEEESGYEAIFEDNGYLYVVRESILHHNVKHKSEEMKQQVASSSYHAIIEQLEIVRSDGNNDDLDASYNVVEACRCELEFEGDSKGYEGAIAVHDLEGTLTILGLCEGNHCSEERKKDKGNGVVVAMQKEYDDTDGTSCMWKTKRHISLPPSVKFTDYSAIARNDQEDDRIAVTSQEDSQLYIGKLLGKDETSGLWDIDAIEFDKDNVKIYDFPKNDNCETVYCNIEGIHWLGDKNMLVAVSDKMKSKGKQPFRCFEKDQSVHAFVIPN